MLCSLAQQKVIGSCSQEVFQDAYTQPYLISVIMLCVITKYQAKFSSETKIYEQLISTSVQAA